MQALIGADITMVLDICPAAQVSKSVHQEAMLRTANWATRARNAFLRSPFSAVQCQFGIVQGGTHHDLRMESTERTLEIGF